MLKVSRTPPCSGPPDTLKLSRDSLEKLPDAPAGTPPGRRAKRAAQVGCWTVGLAVFLSEFPASLRVQEGGARRGCQAGVGEVVHYVAVGPCRDIWVYDCI